MYIGVATEAVARESPLIPRGGWRVEAGSPFTLAWFTSFFSLRRWTSTSSAIQSLLIAQDHNTTGEMIIGSIITRFFGADVECDVRLLVGGCTACSFGGFLSLNLSFTGGACCFS